MSHSRRITLVIAFAGCTACSKPSSQPEPQTSTAVTAPPPADVIEDEAPAKVEPIITELELRDRMRKLWQDHASWTRFYIVSALAGMPDTSAVLARLVRNQVDIGDAVAPFLGRSLGDALAALLREHITVAAEIVIAANDGDKVKVDAANARWTDNADSIAALLAKANPAWLEPDLKVMMRVHLAQTIIEVTTRITADWAGDVKAYDAIVEHVLAMANELSAGLVRQFPSKIAGAGAPSAKAAQLHRDMRELWQAHVLWAREFVMSSIGGLPDVAAVTARLIQNQIDIGDAIKPFYGAAAGEQLTTLLREHINITSDALKAAKTGDDSALAEVRVRGTTNTDRLAAFFAGVNPNWVADDLKIMMRRHRDQTFGEVRARISGESLVDIAAYDYAVNHANRIADALSDGIAQQFPDKL